MNTNQISELFHLYEKLNDPIGYKGHNEPRRIAESTTSATHRLAWLRNPLVSALAFLLIAIFVFLSACQTDLSIAAENRPESQVEPSISSEELIGRWRTGGGVLIITFNEDGTYKVGTLEFGLFQLDGTVLTLNTAQGTPFCSDKSGTYDLDLTESGKLRWTLIDDECNDRVKLADNALWSPISP